jgi:hypothetical protein
VTYKKFGRKYTVPADEAPEVPTAAQVKRIRSKGRYLSRIRALAQAAPTAPETSPGLVFATTGKTAATTREERARKNLERAGLVRAAAAGAGAGAAPTPASA